MQALRLPGLMLLWLGAFTLAFPSCAPLAESKGRNADQRNTKTIRGSVVGDQGAIAGAIVRIQATGTATTTDADGHFILPVRGSGAERIALTAWAAGFYCGGPEPARADQKDVKIHLRPVFRGDNAKYGWLSGKSSEKTEEGQGCAGCHSKPNTGLQLRYPVEEWLSDSHSGSAVNRIFLSMYLGTDAGGNRSPQTRWARNRDYGAFPLFPDPTRPYYGPGYKLDFPQTAGNCSCCHVPAAAVNNPLGTDPANVEGTALEGITCDFCHKIWAVRLDPETGLPRENMPGVLSFEFRRPPKGHQYFAGPYDDVIAGEDTYSPLFRESEICAPCHFGVFWGTVIYNSFGEWKASLYSDPGFPGAKTCQDCHMPRGRADHFALPEKGGLKRDPATIATHLMPGVSDAEFMRNSASLSMTAKQDGQRIEVEVRVTNDRTGHHLPTDSPMRHMILVVGAWEGTGTRIELADGPLLPDWTGDLRGLPGRAYAKILEDLWTKVSPAATYWNPTRIRSDTRLAAFSTDTSRYSFRASGENSVTIESRLVYRRAFQELAALKKWNVSDLEIARCRIVVDPRDPLR